MDLPTFQDNPKNKMTPEDTEVQNNTERTHLGEKLQKNKSSQLKELFFCIDY